MRAIATIILSTSICIQSFSQEYPDSATVERTLDEITVQAPSVIRKTDRDVYAISEEVKKVLISVQSTHQHRYSINFGK